MKRKIIFTIFGIVFLMSGLSLSVKAQEWTPVQKEVWKNVNDYWALMTKGDITGFMEYFHKDYLGWDDESALPATKEETQKWLQYMYQGVKIPLYEIKPLGIRVYGDVAFVHYNYSLVRESEGKKKAEQGRWTDILLKQGNKWVLIGDNGGETSKDK